MNINLEEFQIKIKQHVNKLHKTQRYQYLLIGFVILSQILIILVAYLPVFIFMNPLFECNGEITPEEDACLIIDQCRITNDFTAVPRLDLYCDNEDFRGLAQSLSSFGGIIGMLTIVPFGDFKGKRITIIISMALQLIGAILTYIGIQTINWAVIIAGQLMLGISYAGLQIASYVMMVQYLPDKLCQFALMLSLSAWGFGQMLYLPIYYFLPQWDNFLWIVIIIPNIGMFLVCLFFLVQHPAFCIIHLKDFKLFSNNIIQISMYNQSDPQDIEALHSLGKQYLQALQLNTSEHQSSNLQKQKKSLKEYLTKLFCNKKNVTPLVCLSLIFTAYTIYYEGTDFSMERTGFNYGVSMFLEGLQLFIFYLIFGVLISKFKMKRKWGLGISMICIVVTGSFFMFSFVKDSKAVQSVFLVFSSIFGVFAYSYFVLLQVQSFPVQIMSTAQGIIQSFCQLTAIFVPYFVLKMNDMGIHPIAASSVILLILGLIPIIFLRQTLGTFKVNPGLDNSISVQIKSSLNTEVNA